ncbi:pleiotropic regulator 1-like [Artemia franciscana]|uniref:Pleiotropic regulator 1 n=1 Tax=Artemia franciscana TaxID=6661 RepID=A0AA88HV34_ARTSF|nr:hypothetical protein QYM36_010800 [Artemia franciscana]
MAMDVQKHSVHTLVFRSLKRSHDLFISNHDVLPPPDAEAMKLMKAIKAKDQYGPVLEEVKKQKLSQVQGEKLAIKGPETLAIKSADLAMPTGGALLPFAPGAQGGSTAAGQGNVPGGTVAARKPPVMPKPAWHPPWKLYRVISGHHGWVRCISVDPTNQWFATGSNDRLIKIWDLASGVCKLSLTGHISAVRGLAVSDRHPYLFSCGEDKQVKCWDLEQNKVIRHYHGHLSACYALALHPTIDILVTAGRDSTVRVWDMRTKANVHVLTGHTNTVASLVCQGAEPQIISGSHDSTVRLWDLAGGKSICSLTNHKKSVRSVVLHPTQYTFASASADNIKQWKCPDGKFIQNLSGHNAIVNAMAVNPDGVLVSGADNGSVNFWDWRTGYNFQKHQTTVQPGSLDSEAGIFALSFDQSGTRLITGEADKTIKLYKEDETASEETHPILWKPDILKKRRF